MTSETAAVLVAVRVRPFSCRESPIECTVTVPNSNTVVLTDVGTVSDGNNVSGSGQQHVFSFDKIFWSVPTHVLPIGSSTLPPPIISPMNAHAVTPISRSGSVAGTCSSAASTCTGVADAPVPHNSLPCFARVPDYDDQARVYDFIGQRIYEPVMRGFNACLFAYGQTGSGKTHSVMGPPDAVSLKSDGRGIMPRLCEDLFAMMHKEREEDESVTYNVECSFLEIYCERVRDLLVHNSHGGRDSSTAYVGSSVNSTGTGSAPNLNVSSSALRVRQHPMRGPYVEGLSLVKVRDAAGVMQQLTGGLRERATAETRMNEHSSRSHAILQLLITRVAVVREETGVVTKTRTCKVSMVDLAGSERIAQSGATGDRFEEARNINLSLSTLGRVIQQLTEKQAGRNIVPAYRDSILTWLLSDSLGGNSKTIMLATIAPSAYCYQQSLNTLRFAGVTKKVVNVATLNEDRHFQKLITALRQQIVKLTIQLEEGKASEVHLQQIESLRRERDDLDGRAGALLAQLREMVPVAELASLQRRVEELEKSNVNLRNECTQLRRQAVSSTAALREELAAKRAEISQLTKSLAQKNSAAHDSAHCSEEEPANREHISAPSLFSQSSHDTNHNSTKFHPPAPQAFSRIQSLQSLESLPSQKSVFRPNWSQVSTAVTTPRTAAPHVVAEPRRASGSAPPPSASASALALPLPSALASTSAPGPRDRRRLAALEAELAAARADAAELRRCLTARDAALAAAQSDLAAARARLRSAAHSDSGSAKRERELAAQLDHARGEYLSEKQANVDLLLRMSRAEEAAQQRARELREQARDVAELELLLLEETETSERYYLRLRWQRETHTLHVRFLTILKKSQVSAETQDSSALAWRLRHAEEALAAATAERVALLEAKATTAGEALCARREAEAQAAEVARLAETNDALVARLVAAEPTYTGEDEIDIEGETITEDEANMKNKSDTRATPSYREALGALHAQMETERRLFAERSRAAQSERDELLSDLALARAERTASLRESTQIVKDHERRVVDLESLVAVLRTALDKETASVDAARAALAQAESARYDAEREAEGLRSEAEREVTHLRETLREMRVAYEAIERRLLQYKGAESDVYVAFDRAKFGEDEGWMEAARREQEQLERQKRDARRLNEELLETVRKRNASLRAVDRQITKLQRGGVSPDTTELEDDESPLKEQLRVDS